MRVAIIGGGLAGCAAAYVLKVAGAEPVIYDRTGSLAQATSGNSIGFYNPRFGAEASPQSEFYARGYQRAIELFPGLEDVDYKSSGCLHLIMDEKKARRFPKTIESWKIYGFDDVDMRLIDVDEASDLAGIDIDKPALFLPRGGSVAPKKLCAAYAKGVEVRDSFTGMDFDALPDADVVILAGGADMRKHDLVKPLDLRTVRGQVTFFKENVRSKHLKAHITYGGYVSPSIDGVHVMGATFQRWLSHAEALEKDNADNIAKMQAALPGLGGDVEIVGHRAGVRCVARDHFPVVGRLHDHVYVSLAHGSHGIVSSIMAAEILAAQILDLPQKVSDECLEALSPNRLMP